jgi:homotetrameric cytidine deaminase
MARANVELKARLPDPEAALAAALRLGAADQGVLVQRDHYWQPARGRLKLREIQGRRAELIAYGRTDATEARVSRYTVAPVHGPGPLRAVLSQALPARGAVVKRRRLLLWEGVRIHLDEVEGLGSFLEFEAVIPDAGEEPEAHAKVTRLREALGVSDGYLIAVGYADLVFGGRDELLRAARSVLPHAYAPYSNFPVAAALRSASGVIHTGVNVENAAHPQAQCAEASALGALIGAGERRITAVAVVASGSKHCTPCGGCRQRLREFAAPDTPVYLEDGETTVGALLPDAFAPEHG